MDSVEYYKPGEEMNERGWEPVVSAQPTILAKPLLGAIVTKNTRNGMRLADSTTTSKRDGCETFSNSPM